MKTIKVPTTEMEIVRCPQWDERFGGLCYGLKPKGIDAYYNVGSEEYCKQQLEEFKRYED